MKRDSEREKVALEHGAAKLFLRCYEQHTGIHMRHIWHNEPNRPDVSCYQANEQLDIEVAHLYPSHLKMQNSAFHRSLISRRYFARMAIPFKKEQR